MIRATGHPVSRVTTRDHIAWAANQRFKLSARGGRLNGKGSVLIAAAAGRSLCAIRWADKDTSTLTELTDD